MKATLDSSAMRPTARYCRSRTRTLTGPHNLIKTNLTKAWAKWVTMISMLAILVLPALLVLTEAAAAMDHQTTLAKIVAALPCPPWSISTSSSSSCRSEQSKVALATAQWCRAGIMPMVACTSGIATILALTGKAHASCCL